MTVTPRWSLTLAIIFTLTSDVFSQGVPQKLTLRECITRGLEKNADVLRSKYEIDRAGSFKTMATGQYLPDLRVSASWTRTDQDLIRFRANDLVRSRNSYSYSVTSSLTLFDGFSMFQNSDRSVLNFEASEQSHKRREEMLVYSIQQGFYNVLRLQQLVKVNEGNLERSRQQLSRIQEMNAVGAVALADVYRQQVQLGRDELTLLQSQNDYQNALIDFQILMGLSADMQIEVVANDEIEPIKQQDILSNRAGMDDYSVLVQQALTNRADFKQADLNVRSAMKSVSIARAAHWPIAQAYADYSWNNIELKDINAYDRLSYGVQVSLPVFNRFQTSTTVERSEIDKINAEISKDELSRAIAADIQKAMNTLAAAEKNVEISQRTLRSAQEDQRIASERYNLGAGTLLDLITANVNLAAAESDIINASFNYRIALKLLDYQIGKLSY